jgi:hypothetical protein
VVDGYGPPPPGVVGADGPFEEPAAGAASGIPGGPPDGASDGPPGAAAYRGVAGRERSGRERPDRRGSWVTAQLAYILVLCGVAAGLGIVASDHFKRGGVLIAAAIFAGALARLVLPEHRVGMLANRSRLIDVVTLTAVAVTLGFASAWLPPPQ